MSVFGGLCPLVISALSVVLQPATLAAGVVVLCAAAIAFICSIALIKVVPDANAPCPAGKQVGFFEQHAKACREAMELKDVVASDPQAASIR